MLIEINGEPHETDPTITDPFRVNDHRGVLAAIMANPAHALRQAEEAGGTMWVWARKCGTIDPYAWHPFADFRPESASRPVEDRDQDVRNRVVRDGVLDELRLVALADQSARAVQAATSVEDAVWTAIGHATASWTNLRGAGTFHSERARAIGAALVDRIQSEVRASREVGRQDERDAASRRLTEQRRAELEPVHMLVKVPIGADGWTGRAGTACDVPPVLGEGNGGFSWHSAYVTCERCMTVMRGWAPPQAPQEDREDEGRAFGWLDASRPAEGHTASLTVAVLHDGTPIRTETVPDPTTPVMVTATLPTNSRLDLIVGHDHGEVQDRVAELARVQPEEDWELPLIPPAPPAACGQDPCEHAPDGGNHPTVPGRPAVLAAAEHGPIPESIPLPEPGALDEPNDHPVDGFR